MIERYETSHLFDVIATEAHTMHDHEWTSAPGLRSAGAGCLFMGILISTLGCGPATPFPVANVEGSVTYQGQPLGHGRVAFLPEAGTPGPAAVGVIQPNGSFRIRTAGFDGAAIGNHLVTVHCRGESIAKEDQNSAVLQIPNSLIPVKYSNTETSPLRFEVKEGPNEYSIVLD